MVSPEKLVRNHIRELKAYSSARDEYKGAAGVFLDANENAIGSVTHSQVNRYPDPHHSHLKKQWAQIKGINPNQVFFGNGSDEPIDLLIRMFCDPGKDHIITLPPTYGMYSVSAAINTVEEIQIPLTKDFLIDMMAIKKRVNTRSKIIFLCSPNNPTGNLLDRLSIVEILELFEGMVVIDEAYIDFSNQPSWVEVLNNYPNLVVLQTLSKAWGMAGIRIGAAMGDPFVISMLDKIKPPYNLSLPNQQLAIEAIEKVALKDHGVKQILTQRARMETALSELPIVSQIFRSDSNFLLVRFSGAKKVFDYLIGHQVIVRDRSSQVHCEDCLRITIGTKEENDRLLSLLKEFQ